MRLRWDGIEWGGPKDDWFYVYWWNWLSKNTRYLGPYCMWYDGPHNSFGLWFTNISWYLPGSKDHSEDWSPWIESEYDKKSRARYEAEQKAKEEALNATSKQE